MEDYLESAVSQIIEVLKSRGKEEISGAKLGELIKTEFPSINIRKVVNILTGPGALSKFIELYLSTTLKRDRKAGVDWIYKIQSAGAQAVGVATTPIFWNVFASPNKSTHLFLDRDSLLLKVVGVAEQEGRAIDEKIDSITKIELSGIQQKFLTSIIDEKTRNELLASLGNIDSYPIWVNSLKKSNSGEYRRWVEFRRNEIGQIFCNKLNMLGLDESQRTKLLSQLLDSQAVQYRQNKNKKQQFPIQSSAPPTRDASLATGSIAEQKFRESLIRILSNMPIAELRQIKIPYGNVFDELTHNK